MQTRSTGRRRIELTEVDWYSTQWVAIQRRLLNTSGKVVLDLSNVKWFDLWPLAQLLKLLFSRMVTTGRTTAIKIPYARRELPLGEKQKPLCFLADIGFLSLFIEWGGACLIGETPMPLNISPNTTSGLADKSLDRLHRYGYRRKAYKDMILLPFTMLRSPKDVDVIKESLHKYVSDWLAYYEREIAEGNLIDIFYRELAENAVEHGKGAPAFVTARLVRSVWDLTEKQRKGVMSRRLKGKLPPMRNFLKKYENDGFVELVVVDDGPGIEGSLPMDGQARGSAASMFRYAMRPEVSRHSLEVRLKRGKSRLTGLGACANCLERLPAILMFREAKHGASVWEGKQRSKNDLLRLRFSSLRQYQGEQTRGCNIQLALAIAPLSWRGRPISIGPKCGDTLGYVSLFARVERRKEAIRSSESFEMYRSSTLKKYTPCLIDLTNVPADKDTAWHAAKVIVAMEREVSAPVILVGITRSLAARLTDSLSHLNEDVDDANEQYNGPGWIGLSSELHIHFVGSDLALARYVRDGFSSGLFPREPSAFRKVVHDDMRLCNYGRGPVLSPTDVFWNWQAGLSARAMAEVAERELLVSDCVVKLPNGQCTTRLLDLYGALMSGSIRRALLKAAEQEIARLAPDIIVTYSSVVRRFCFDLLKKRFPDIVQVDLPTPYAMASRIAALRHHRLQRTLILADIVNTGSHVTRVARGCETVGMKVIHALALLDSHPRGAAPSCHVPYSSLLRYPNVVVKGPPKITHVVDRYTLCLRKAEDDMGPAVIPCRTRTETAAFYNFVNRQKAILDQHCINHAGHHFAVAVDFRQITRADTLNHLIQGLRDFAKGCGAIVVPSEAIIGECVFDIADKLGVPHENIVCAIEGRRIVREYRFSAVDETKLRSVAQDGGFVLLLDDAIHHGQVLGTIAEHVAALGIRRVAAWFILDNRPPGSGLISRLRFGSLGEVNVDTRALLRSFFPAFGTSLSCPFCRIAAGYHRASRAKPNGLISQQILARLSELRPIDPRTAVLDPWRYRTINPVRVPTPTIDIGTPETADSPETLSLALLEMSQYEEGVVAILSAFAERKLAGFDETVSRVLSRSIGTIEKMGLRARFVDPLRTIVREWSADYCAEIMESALLWPVEILSEEVCGFLEDANEKTLNSDSYLTVLFALVRKALDGCTDADRDRILSTAERIVERTPKDLITYGVVQSLFSSFRRYGDRHREFHWGLSLLAKRLMIHRYPWHRIKEQIPNLAARLTCARVADILGLGKDDYSIEDFAILLSLADIGEAITLMVTLGELRETQNVERLVLEIQNILRQRGELRERWRTGERLPEEFVEARVNGIKDGLKAVSELLNSPYPQKRVEELYSLLENRVVLLRDSLVRPLHSRLEKAVPMPVSITAGFEEQCEHIYIVVDPIVLNSLMVSIAENVKQHADQDFIKPVVIDGDTSVPGVCTISIQNACDDADAESEFLRGRDYHSLASSLFTFGARYSGTFKDTTFTTTVTFTTVI